MTDLLTFLQTNKEALPVVAAIIGGAFALWRWTVDQRWRRVQYAHGLIKEFMVQKNTIKALQMLDAAGRQIELFPDAKKNKLVYVREDIIIESLKTFDEQTDFKAIPFAVRVIFDEFFTELSTFQHHIDAGLIKLQDVKPYLEYWIKSINGYGKVHSDEVATQINKFLNYFDYKAVIQLSASMGYPYPNPENQRTPVQTP